MMKMRLEKNMKSKFTLLELLIVVATIGILVTLLMPSLSNARKKAKGAVCRSRLSQVYAFTLRYAQENNNKFVSNTHISKQKGRIYWYRQFTNSGRKYALEHQEILACPVVHDVHVPKSLRTTGMNLHLNWKKTRPDILNLQT